MGNSDVLKWSKLIPLSKNEVEKLSLKNIQGVFRISKKEHDDKFYVVYVGSSQDLSETLLKLFSDKENNFLKIDGDFSFRYAEVKSEEMRRAIEKQMYKQYVPKFNPTEPKSDLDVRVNLN